MIMASLLDLGAASQAAESVGCRLEVLPLEEGQHHGLPGGL
jgi:hypothetical protein